MKKIIEQINNVEVFSNFLEKYKLFRELPEQYKSIKFCKLYMKIYNYMLSIPKDKIVVKTIFSEGYLGRHGLLSFLKYFIEVKDFYKWKERIYSLLVEKIGSTDYRKYQLLYGSKANEFFNQYLEKQKSTFKENWDTDNPAQSKEVQDKMKKTCIERYGVEHPLQSKEIQDKMKATCMKNLGVKNPAQSKEVQDKMKITNLERYGKEFYTQTEEYLKKSKETSRKNWGTDNPMQSKVIQEKTKNTCMKNYGVEWYVSSLECKKSFGFHSKIGDDMCKSLDILMNTKNSNYTYYATKNGEFSLSTEDNHNFYYDYTNTVEKWMVEFQGMYAHGLLEGQEYSYSRPIKEVWKRDEEKRILAEQNGYKVFYVYENEYRNNKSKCLENLINQIKEYLETHSNMPRMSQAAQ